jgi:hypothetical protein
MLISPCEYSSRIDFGCFTFIDVFPQLDCDLRIENTGLDELVTVGSAEGFDVKR